MKLKSFKLFSICTSVAVFITSQIPTLPAKSGIFDGFGRCGSAGEGHVTVTNNLRTTVYVLTDKNDKAGGPDGAELAPGQSNRTPICNRNGLRVKVYTSTKCGKTFLSESRFSRVYNEDFVSIKPSGFAFRVGDVLDVGSRIGGVALTYIAAGYGIPPEALSALGVNEAEVTGACLKGGIGCARAIYKYKDKLPSDLLTTINADKCLATILQPRSSSDSSPIIEQHCISVDSRQGWQRFNLPRNFTKIANIRGGWSVDTRSYASVGAFGHTGRDAEALRPYNQYKFDQRFPFGALLMGSGQGSLWIQDSNSFSSAPFGAVDMRINDADNALGDNGGSLQVCFSN
jgi:hypothetical protein